MSRSSQDLIFCIKKKKYSFSDHSLIPSQVTNNLNVPIMVQDFVIHKQLGPAAVPDKVTKPGCRLTPSAEAAAIAAVTERQELSLLRGCSLSVSYHS